MSKQNSIPKIAPSILSSNFCKLESEILAIYEAGADLIHLDIMDGHFVPNLTFGLPVVESIKKVSKLPLDAHLMVMNPDDYIESFARLGVKYFSFHTEAVHHHHRTIQKIKSTGMKAGIAINPGTPISSIFDLLTELDFVLIMSVNPGFSGQKFIDFCIKKVQALNDIRAEKDLKFEIEIDGGIDAETIKPVISAGIDIVVSGAYIFQNKDYKAAIENLKRDRN